MKNVKKWTLLERYLHQEIGIEFKACLYFFCILFRLCLDFIYTRETKEKQEPGKVKSKNKRRRIFTATKQFFQFILCHCNFPLYLSYLIIHKHLYL